MQRRRATAGWAVAVLGACLAVAGGAAFACTNLATVNLSSPMGKPGEAITLTGTGFMASMDEMPMDGMVMDMGPGGSGMMGTTSGLTVRPPVVLRWNGPNGPVLSEAIPDKTGSISVLFTVPDAQPGHYMVVAVQKTPQGNDVYGTPARAPIQILGPGQSPADAARGAASAGAGGPSGSGGVLALTVGLGVLGLGLLAGGVVATARTVRSRRDVPVTVDGRRD